MSTRARLILVSLIALVAALGVAGGAALVGRGDDGGEKPTGAPPFVVDLGVRDDGEARALRSAAEAYGEERRARAGRILEGRRSLQGRVRQPRAARTAGARASTERRRALPPRPCPLLGRRPRGGGRGLAGDTVARSRQR